MLLTLSILEIRLRSWWLAAVGAIVLTFLIYSFKSARTRSLSIRAGIVTVGALVLIFMAASSSQIVADYLSQKITWVGSAFEEANTGTEDARWREVHDVARVYALMSSDSLLWKAEGVGFVASGSAGEQEFGFTSETNDSGWVEVFVTGGFIGSFIIIMMSGAVLWDLWKEASLTLDVGMAAMIVWLITIVTMATFNWLLWDMYFVPVVWLLALAKVAPKMQRRPVKQTLLATTVLPPRPARPIDGGLTTAG